MHLDNGAEEKVEPDTTLCRTRPLGVHVPGTRQQMYYCLPEFLLCKYIRPFGFDCLCRHPDAPSFNRGNSCPLGS